MLFRGIWEHVVLFEFTQITIAQLQTNMRSDENDLDLLMFIEMAPMDLAEMSLEDFLFTSGKGGYFLLVM